MPKFLMGAIVLLLLLGAGYGITQAARAIPWDCSDWQAFAHDDRTTVILESLAENRGKTLYCGVDQSDTFTKTETWEAGKDRNERDDTIYSGERGQFRGFIAAQEGWLTDGESGVTGVSIDRIFEFPREKKKRRRWVTKRRPVPDTADRSMRGGWGPYGAAHATEATRQANADAQLTANVPFTEWQSMAETDALSYCRSQSYHRAIDVALVDGATREYEDNTANPPATRARLVRTWTATCEKRVRR